MLAEKTLGKINLKLQGNLWSQVLGKRLREHCIAVDIAAHKNVCIPRKTIPYPNNWFSSMIIEWQRRHHLFWRRDLVRLVSLLLPADKQLTDVFQTHSDQSSRLNSLTEHCPSLCLSSHEMACLQKKFNTSFSYSLNISMHCHNTKYSQWELKG